MTLSSIVLRTAFRRIAWKHLPLKDEAEAGGWLDTRSLENCYQQVDEEMLLRVASEPRKLRETIAETIAASRVSRAALRGGSFIGILVPPLSLDSSLAKPSGSRTGGGNDPGRRGEGSDKRS